MTRADMSELTDVWKGENTDVHTDRLVQGRFGKRTISASRQATDRVVLVPSAIAPSSGISAKKAREHELPNGNRAVDSRAAFYLTQLTHHLFEHGVICNAWRYERAGYHGFMRCELPPDTCPGKKVPICNRTCKHPIRHTLRACSWVLHSQVAVRHERDRIFTRDG